MRLAAVAIAALTALSACKDSPAPPHIPPVNVEKDAVHGSGQADTQAPAGKVTTQPAGPRIEAPVPSEQLPEAAKTAEGSRTKEGATTADPSKVEACVDAYLAEKGLNEYGDPKDTMYAGGNPLFDESTGRKMDRIDYVLLKHPELRERCLE